MKRILWLAFTALALLAGVWTMKSAGCAAPGGATSGGHSVPDEQDPETSALQVPSTTEADTRKPVAGKAAKALEVQATGELEIELDLAWKLTGLTMVAHEAPVTGVENLIAEGQGRSLPVIGGAWSGRLWMNALPNGRYVLQNVRPGVELEFREHFSGNGLLDRVRDGIIDSREDQLREEPGVLPLGPTKVVGDPLHGREAGPILASQTVALEPGELRRITVGRAGAPEVTFEAVNLDGEPLAGARLRLFRLEQSLGRRNVELSNQELGKTGRLPLRLPLGTYDVTVWQEDGLAERLTHLAITEEAFVQLTLAAQPDTIVTVRAADGEPVWWPDGSLYARDGHNYIVKAIDRSNEEDGSYRLPGLIGNDWQLVLPVNGMEDVPVNWPGEPMEVTLPELGSTRFRTQVDQPFGYPDGMRDSCSAQIALRHLASGTLVRQTTRLHASKELQMTTSSMVTGRWTATLIFPSDLSPDSLAIRREIVREFDVHQGERTEVRF